jgi:hypothetical protein
MINTRSAPAIVSHATQAVFDIVDSLSEVMENDDAKKIGNHGCRSFSI